MYAITSEQPGGPELLRWSEVPDLTPAATEVLIKVRASAVNRADLLQRQGFYDPPPGESAILGLECSGWVAAVGDGVTGWREGDEVCALLAGGGYAQFATAPAGQLLPKPAKVSLAEAAALPEAACTVWSNVADVARLQAGETLLVHGGGSGIGTFAIQFGKAIGANVLATARPGKHATLRALGADTVIDYTSEDFVAATKEATAGRGADVILDIMGASYLARNVAALAAGGRLVIIGLQGGRKAELDISAVLNKRASVIATSLRRRSHGDKARIISGVRRDIWPLIEAGAIKPVVDRQLPMSQAALAHTVVAASEHLGKVLLVND